MRKLQEILNDYSNQCAQLGDLLMRHDHMKSAIEQKKRQINVLEAEARSAQEEEAAKAKQESKDEDKKA